MFVFVFAPETEIHAFNAFRCLNRHGTPPKENLARVGQMICIICATYPLYSS